MDPYADIDLESSTFNARDPFDSALFQCRNSTFLLSMKSPSLTILPHNPKPSHPMSSHPNNPKPKQGHPMSSHPKTSKPNPSPMGNMGGHPMNPKPSFLQQLPPSLEKAPPSDSMEVSRLRSLLFNEDKEVEYQRILNTKNRELQALRTEIRKINMNLSHISSNTENRVPRSEGHEEGLILLQKSMRYSLEKCKGCFKTFQARNAQMMELVSMLDAVRRTGVKEADVLQMKVLYATLSRDLEGFGAQSVELAESLRLLNEKNLENVQLSARMEKLSARCSFFQQREQEARARESFLTEELKARGKLLHAEENKSAEQGKKAFVLGKLVKALKTKDTGREDQNNYKTVISELVKETEALKRVIMNKDRELAQQRELNDKLQVRLAGYAKRLELLQLNLRKPEETGGEVAQVQDPETEGFSLLREGKLPALLDYRNAGMSAVMTNLLMDIETQGPEALIEYLRQETDGPEDRVAVLETLANQYVSYRAFAESLNSLLFQMMRLTQIGSVPEMLAGFSGTMAQVMKCTDARVWLDDKMTGVVYSYNAQGAPVRAMSGRGLLGRSLELCQPITRLLDRNQFLCELILDSEIQKTLVDGVLLLPLDPTLQKTRAVIEFSGFGSLPDKTRLLDCEYLSLLTSLLLYPLLSKLEKQAADSQNLRLQDIYQSALVNLCSSSSDFDFSERTKHWACRMFNVSICGFFFCLNGRLIKHLSKGNVEEVALLGVTGRCAQGLKPYVTQNLKNSPEFDSKTDLPTLMPALTFPVTGMLGSERICLGVVQVPIKESGFGRTGTEDSGEMRADVESQALFFGELVQLALRYFRKQWE